MKQDFNQNRRNLKEALLLARQRHLVNTPGRGANAVVASEDTAQIGVTGHVTIEAIYPSGEAKVLMTDRPVVLESGPNLVVRQAEEIMPYMSLGLRQFGYIELGDPAAPLAPDPDDLVLQQTTGQRKAIVGTITGNQATYESQWSTAEGNGYNYTEMGLFTNPLGAGLLFARKTFAAISKDSSFAMKITWALVFRTGDHGAGCQGVALMGGTTTTYDYIYDATGGETQLIVPLDFPVGGKQLDVFMNGQRLVPGRQYYESAIGAYKGIILIGFALKTGAEMYVVNRRLA